MSAFINSLGRADCGRFEISDRKEWLVTNGLGGYAAGTVSGANTRRYHGLLVAALDPPLGRTLLLAKLDETAVSHGQTYPLFTNSWTNDVIDPAGFRYLERFHLEGTTPVWTFACAGALLEKRVWMQPDANTTYIRYNLRRATGSLALNIKAMVNYRDYHSTTHANGWQMQINPVEAGLQIIAFDGATPFYLLSDQAEVAPHHAWYQNYHLSMEAYRGLEDTEDHLYAGSFQVMLQPGQSFTLVASTEAHPNLDGVSAYAARQAAEQRLLASMAASSESNESNSTSTQPAWIQHLALAADQFIVRRPLADDPEGQTVIAGYPWFGDWGRDTMIALPGLTLNTGRPDVARRILKTFARFADQGMLPNLFPDAGQTPEYNTVDAPLWYFEALRAYYAATGDDDLLQDLFSTLQDIIHWHEQGTRYNIQVDPEDGLLYAGESGVQLTWMDAKVGAWVVTPRIGKPVEVNALWHNALRVMADLAKQLKKSKAARQYSEQADFIADSFRRRFWFEAGGYLYDVIDGPEGDLGPDERRYDTSLRPNQIFAVSLPAKLLTDEQAKAVVDTCARHLWTSYGLRSLAVDHPAYTGHYGGDPLQRDGSYHQGAVWGWLLGPFAVAHYRVYNDPALSRSFLAAVQDHLSDACLGSISEIFDGDPPHTPRGAFAQAWSVAEVLRAWQTLAASDK